jgi:phosphoribosyl 1,2-cyclic phosphodiesterase
MNITFYGVRGSCPAPGAAYLRYGGNTACVVLRADDEQPIVLDLGTGVRSFGLTQPGDGTFRGTALLTHLHWDHVQGLPFFAPVHAPGARLDIYGPAQGGRSLAEVFAEWMRPPFFPIGYHELGGTIVFHDVDDDDFAVGNAKVRVRAVPHGGATVGYRVEWHGASLAYISDHQAPADMDTVAESVLELCDGVDLVVHDGQYTPAEFAAKATWGHSTAAYAVTVAQRAGARALALFHHDPEHGDDALDRLVADAAAASSAAGGPEVLGAAEGLTLTL